MSLRDDLVNQQKEQSQKNREKAKEEKALSLQREQNYKQQKAQLQKQKEDAFDAFAQQVKEGHVPDEWVKLYDGYVEKIKEHILKGNLSFHFKDAVSADYYQEKASVNKGKNSVVTLMNDYLTKRLKQDGFSSAKFRLVDEITYYATDQDYADQQARQEINDAKAQADYDSAWNNWYNYDGAGRAPSQSDFKPKQAKLVKTGEKHNYYFVVSGSLYRKSSGKEVDTATDLKIHGIFSVVFGVLFGIFGFAFPFIFPPEKTLPVIGFGFANPIASFFIFLIAGEIFAAFAAFIVGCFRHMRDAVNKKLRALSVVVVSLFLVCVIAGGTAFATLFPFSKLTVDGVTYQVTENWKEYEVTAIDENLTEVTVSTTLRGLPVRQVEWKNFEQVQTLYIKGTDIKRFVSYDHMPSKIVLEEGLTEIPDSTFSRSDIVEVVLPSTITKIGDGAFYNCTNLKRINLGDNLNFVGESAFKGCVSLEELYLGHSFQTSYVSSFSGLSGLKKVILNCNNVPGNETMQYSWYLLDTKTANGLEFVIGKDVEVAPYFNLFEHHGSVNEFNTVSTVTFEDGCKVRELDGTFRGFYNLTSVVLPESVKKVGKSTFEQCQSLESIDLSGVTELDTENLFTNHYSLLNRSSETSGILDYCRENDILFFSYMVLEQGALTGKYDTDHPFPEDSDRGRTYNPMLPQLEKLNARLEEIADHHNAAAAQIPTAWAIAKGTLPIIGVTKVYQAEDAAKAAEIKLTEEEIASLEQLADQTQLNVIRYWEKEMR